MPTASRRRALITGGSAGFGSALVNAFAQNGFDVVVCGRDRDRLNSVCRQVRKTSSADVWELVADLCSQEGIEAIAGELRSHDIDSVVNNAAINPELLAKQRLTAPADVAEVIATNTSAAIAVCMAAFDHFRTRGLGSIININSVAGWRGSSHEPVYAASKFGLRGFSESVKDAWLSKGVRMTDLYVGAIATGMSAGRPDVADLIDPAELAAYVVTLCQTESFLVREASIQKTSLAARQHKRVVFTNGVFDLLHPGHLAILKFARSRGDRLVVGLNSDRSVRALKGPSRPVQTEQTRKIVLEELPFVDEVVIFDELRPTAMIRQLMPDVVIKGADYTVADIRAADDIPESIEIVTFPVILGPEGEKISTTAAIEKARKTK